MLNPKKSLGQNFLNDKNICKKIVNLLDIKNNIIIEIGPGTGQITNEIILKNPKKLILIEKDEKLYENLKIKYKAYKKVNILNIDALNYDYSKNSNTNIISNLPYNVSNQIIFNLLMNYNNINELVLMVQKEVAEKFNYNNKYKNNKYKFMMSLYTNYKIMFNISNKVFYPKPKVKSSIIKLVTKKNTIDKNHLIKFIDKIFKNKRKIIKNNINIISDNNHINNLLNRRVEDINNEDLLLLFNKF